MWTKQKRRTNKSRFILPVFTLIVLSYFLYHIYHGAYGLESREAVGRHIATLNFEYESLKMKNILLGERISLLQDGKIERDMLDEYARRDLNLSGAKELIIFTKGG